MTALRRLHDQLVTNEGADCRCRDWGTRWCPAMQAANRQHQADSDQLELDQTPEPDSTYNQLPDDY